MLKARILYDLHLKVAHSSSYPEHEMHFLNLLEKSIKEPLMHGFS